jgi:hypothetical protein
MSPFKDRVRSSAPGCAGLGSRNRDVDLYLSGESWCAEKCLMSLNRNVRTQCFQSEDSAAAAEFLFELMLHEAMSLGDDL